jgi:RNA polymerase sigma factor (sigma-70 family)
VKPPETECYPDQIADHRSFDDAGAFEDAEHLRHALDQLPIHQREVLTLFFLDDLSLEELSTLIEIPVGTVKSRLHYAKAGPTRDPLERSIPCPISPPIWFKA